MSIDSAFSGSMRYSAWRNPPGRLVREKTPDSAAFGWSERHLQCVWFDPQWRPPILHTADGEAVQVESPGRWNLEAGPDFLDAALIVGPARRRVQGDVEIHVRPSDWQAHHHGSDANYDRLIAHVCHFEGPIPRQPPPPHVLRISLRRDLLANHRFSFDNIDLTAYPYGSLSPNPPCRQILAPALPEDKALLLDAAGEERLRLKALRMSAEIAEKGGAQVLYEEIMAALGYKHNKLAARELAVQLPLDRLREESEGAPWKAHALLLGMAGLLPVRASPQWADDTRLQVRQLWDYWWKHQSALENRALPATAWKRGGQRPLNNPVRRLAAAAALFGGSFELANDFLALDESSPRKWFRQAAALLARTRGMEYWTRRLGFSGPPQKHPAALLGPDRIASILANGVIPFLAASGRPIRALLPELPPEHENTIIRQGADRLFGRDQNPALYQPGLRQQGLIQIFCDFCLTRKTGCADCALAANLASAFPPAHSRPGRHEGDERRPL